jgi:hypothetical protein
VTKRLHSFFVAGLIWLLSTPLAAHHSTAVYDLSSDIRIDGVVTALRWANPHVYIQVRQDGEDGESREWNIEGQTPSGMSRAGWTRDSLKPGETVTVAANPPRNPDRGIALGHTVLKSDGTVLQIPQANTRGRNTEPATVAVASSIGGHWVTRWNPTVALQFLRPQTSLSLTEQGAAAIAGYNNSLNPGNDCVPEPIPYVMIWPNGKFIEVTDEAIFIRDELGPERRVDLAASNHEGAEPSVGGHSIGRWEGDTLVVDTAGFAPHRRGLAVSGLASGPNKRLVERFELSADKSALLYEFHLEDPDYLAEPVTGTLELAYRPDIPFVNEPCDPESARIYLEN